MRWHLAIILTLAAILNFYQLGRADVITDESSYATRAIGMIDFDFGIEQPTPWQWIDTLPPWWMRLSFHDHPPLVFLLQHLSIRIFGEHPTAIRIPSAIAGIVAVWLAYLIGRRLYGTAVGLIAAALLAVTVNHVWISRTGLQESILLTLMLASAYCFLHAVTRLNPSLPMVYTIDTEEGDDASHHETRRHDGWWLAASGAFLGLAFLAKYLALILIPIFITILLLRLLCAARVSGIHRIRRGLGYSHDRGNNRSPTLWRLGAGLLVCIAVASPVAIYNLELYRAFGHFDFQLSMLFGQETPRWPSRPAQEALGSIANRLRLFLPMLAGSQSPLFLALAAAGIGSMVFEVARRRAVEPRTIRHWPLAVFLGWLTPFLIAVGPTLRFLTLLTPWLAIAAGYGVMRIYRRIATRRRTVELAFVALAALAAFEAFYAYSSLIAPSPIGREHLTYSRLRRESHAWGFNDLNAFLDAKLAGKMPEVAISAEFPFAKKLLDTSIREKQQRGFEPMPWGIVYDGDVNISAQLWVFLRRIAYDGWPVTDAENFRRGTGDFFRASGIKRMYFVAATEYALKDRKRGLTPDAAAIERELIASGIRPTAIQNQRGETAFRVYEFTL